MLVVFLASFVPGLFWLWYFNRFDVGDKESLGRLFLCMVFGAFAVIPALSWEAPFKNLLQGSNSLSLQLGLSFLVVGLGEELFKLVAVYLAASRTPEFSEPMDGIIYAIATAIGFSVVENILYISAFGLVVAPLRGTVATLAHISFSGLAGYFLGRAKFSDQVLSNLGVGLAVATFAHGLYDFLLITNFVSPVVLVLLIGGLQYLLFVAIRRALASSTR
ncbi:MAG: PrsW family intramembrane metalloprotease [Firmicutes bacterium]|nr:PrsW family intramembrane metalloprotease [Bacillota bacterium]